MRTTISDITRRRKAEDELKKYREHLEELVRKRTADLQRANEDPQHEIIARKEAEERTRHLATFPEMNPNPVIELDTAGNVVFANKAAYTGLKKLGLSKHDIGLFLPVDIGDILKAIQRKSDLSFSREVVIRGRTIGETINLVPQLGVARIYARDITDHKLAREALQQSEERFRLIAETSADVIFQLDVNGRVAYCSPAVRSYGYSPDMVLDKSFSEFIVQDDLSKAADAFQRVTLGERLSLFEVRVLKADGSTTDIELSATPIVRNETIVGIQGIARNISERKLAERALRESEQRLRMTQQAAKIGAFEWNVQTGMNIWTPALEAMYGLAPGEFGETQSSWEQLVHPEDRAAAVALVNRAFETGEPISGEWRVTWRDGSMHWIQGRFQLFRDDADRSMRLIGVNIDITERKQVEEALRESEERFRAVFESSSDCILVWDRQGNYLFANQAAIDHVGTTRDKVIGRNIRDGLGHIPDFMHLWLARLEQAFATGEPFRVEDSIPVGGRVVHSESQISPIRDASGRVFAVSVVYRDVTERKQVQEALRQSRLDMGRAQDVAQIGWWRLDIRKNVLTWSDQSYRIFGLPKGTPLTYETFLSAVHPDDCAYVDTEWKAGLQGKPYDIEHRILVNGKTKWLREKAYLEFDKNGSLLGGFGITQDITKKRLIEEELRRTKNGLQVLVAEKTAELRNANRVLENEIAERIEAGKQLTATNSLLKLFCRTFRQKGYLDAVVELLKTQCECECIGIRLIDACGNIPYSASSGLSGDFLEKEDCLSLCKDACACTRIAREKPSRAEAALITLAGSFICNDTSRLQNPSKGSRSAKYRSACMQQGFGSVAVIAIRYRDKVLGVIHLADRSRGKFSRPIVEFIEAATPLIGEALYRFGIKEALVSSRERLRNLSRYLVTAREEERLRVAREIHDELGQTLTAARMELAMLKKVWDKGAAVKQKIPAILELIDNSIEDVQRICSELRPRILDHLGLKAAIEWQAKKFTELGGLSCFLDLPDGQISLPSSVATSVFRIFQEALTNIVRHAKASNVRIRLGIEGSSMMLEIHDDGKGIPAHRISGKDSFGIIGIRERVHELGGRVTFKGVRDKGTTVTITIPLHEGVPGISGSY